MSLPQNLSIVLALALLSLPTQALAQDGGGSAAPEAASPEATMDQPAKAVAPAEATAKHTPEKPASADKAPAKDSHKPSSSIKDANDLTGATQLLSEADANHNPFKDQSLSTRMILNGGIHKGNTFIFDTFTKGDNRRAVRFSEPPEMRGMGVVIKGRDEVYARLPDSDKVRRVGTHSKRQSFYGSDWSMDDMSMIYLAKDYDVVKIIDLDADGGKHVSLELKLKDGVDLPYAKLVIKVDKERKLIPYIEYYDEKLRLKKKQERFDLKDMGGGYLIYSRVVVTDVETKHTTTNEVLSEKINQNLSDDTFSKRWLVRSL